jgi:hypothetical protein
MDVLIGFLLSSVVIIGLMLKRERKNSDCVSNKKNEIETKLSTILEKMEKCETFEQLVTSKDWAIRTIEPSFEFEKYNNEIDVFTMELRHKIDESYKKTHEKIIFQSIKK